MGVISGKPPVFLAKHFLISINNKDI